MKKFLSLLAVQVLFLWLGYSPAFSENAGIVDLIDTPLPEIIDEGGFNVNFRFYSFQSNGRNSNGVLAGLIFGVLDHMNLGVYLDTENLIGEETAKLRRPHLFVKFQIFKGSDRFPAIACGYDDQGYGEYRGRKYEEREKGFFVVLRTERLARFVEISAGINGYDFEQFTMRGFIGMFARMEKSLVPMLEFDNLGAGSKNRINLGLRYFLTPNLHMEIDARDIVHGFDRIFRLGYASHF